jgi:hypothetical protein
MKNIFNKLFAAYKVWLNRRRWERASKKAAQIVQQTKEAWLGCENAEMMASWPAVAGTDPGFKIGGGGRKTIMWGTNAILQSPAPTDSLGSGLNWFTVIRASQKPISDRTKLPNGVGVTSTDVFIIDGVQWEVVVRDDSQFESGSVVAINNLVTIVDFAGLFVKNSTPVTLEARIVDPNYEATLKAAGERTLMIENLVLIDSQTTTAAS